MAAIASMWRWRGGTSGMLLWGKMEKEVREQSWGETAVLVVGNEGSWVGLAGGLGKAALGG